MDDLTKAVSKERLALLNREIDFLEKERDDLLYNYRLLKDKIRRLKRRTIPRLLVIGVYLIINRVIRIRQVIEMKKHVGEHRMSPSQTLLEIYFEYFLTDPTILFYLLLILSIYSIFVGMRLYAMCSKTEHSIMPLKIAGIMNVHNYGMELTGIEAKIRRCDQELRRIKWEADQLPEQ